MMQANRIALYIAYGLLVVAVAWTSWFIKDELDNSRQVDCTVMALEVANFSDTARLAKTPQEVEQAQQRGVVVLSIFEDACRDQLGDAKEKVLHIVDSSRFTPTTTTTDAPPPKKKTKTTTTTTTTTGG